MQRVIIFGSTPFASEEQSDQIDTVLIELYAYSNNLIRELETNDKFVNLSQFERESLFVEKIIAYSKLLKQEIRNESAGDLTIDTEENKEFEEGVKKIPKSSIINPYD